MKSARLRTIIFFCLMLPGAARMVSPVDAREIARKMDELYRSNSSYSEMSMEVVTPDWSRTLEMQVWTSGTDKTLVRILEPKKERGVGTLRIGNEMWNYFPRVNKTIKIPPSMMMSSWMGSDFTNDDLVKEYTLVKDFDFRLVRPGGAREDLLYLEARPKPGVPVVWSRVLLAVRAADLIPVWEEYFDDRDTRMRRMEFSDIRKFGDRQVPAAMSLVPANKPGNRTVLRYKILRFDEPVDDSIMTLRNLRTFK